MDPKTRMTDDWIARALAGTPCTTLDDEFRTCPVRFSFPYLFEPQKPMEAGSEPKYSVTALFPKGADLSVLQQGVFEFAKANFGSHFPNGTYAGGLHLPFRDQQDKAKYDGYVPGAFFLTATSKFKPAVVGPNLNPITDQSRVYAGVWGILKLRLFKYDVKMKKGVSFGLQSAMVVADDEKFTSAGGDPNKDFAGVTVETATDFDPAGQFAGVDGEQPPVDSDKAALAAFGLG